ncbi:MAG: hypothetical protein IPI91_04075 [Flavobacteriales bacterium]|nr:hypothetical protein [Flavobacteriales bacterium]
MHVVLAKYGASVLLVLFRAISDAHLCWVVDHLALVRSFPSDAVASSIAMRTWTITGIVLAILAWSVFKEDAQHAKMDHGETRSARIHPRGDRRRGCITRAHATLL